MAYPCLVHYNTENAYREYFEATYCNSPIITFDGVSVRFRKRDFDHAFFESVRGKDDTFSTKRAERIDWIKHCLQDPNSDRYVGWDKQKKRYDRTRRVAIVMGNYVVVIRLQKCGTKAHFVTAFVADTPSRPGRLSTIQQIRRSPRWAKKNR